MIEDLMAAHPRIFRGERPHVSTSVPNGWYGLLNEFCSLLHTICAEDELSSLHVHGIIDDSGCLALEFTFECKLSETQKQTIDARVFALRNRSMFTCAICGRLAETLEIPALCAKHNKVGSYQS
jgi:hypothetical protein